MTYYAIILIIVVAYVVDKSTCFVIIFDMCIWFKHFICFVAAPTEEEKRSRKNTKQRHQTLNIVKLLLTSCRFPEELKYQKNISTCHKYEWILKDATPHSIEGSDRKYIHQYLRNHPIILWNYRIVLHILNNCRAKFPLLFL